MMKKIKNICFTSILCVFIFLGYTITLADQFVEERRNFFRDNVFVGEGDIAGVLHVHDREDEHIHAHSLELEWYIFPFGIWFYNISSDFIAVSQEEFTLWTEQFPGEGGTRNIREATIRSFVDDFNLTPEDLINEMLRFHTMEEVESWINSERERFGSDSEAYQSARRFTTTSINAIFSNDMQEIQANFPGYSIIYNNQVFSPEWVMDNMYRAIHEKQLPMEEILRIVGLVGFNLRADFLLERMDILISYSPDLGEVRLQPLDMTIERFVDTLENLDQRIMIRRNGNFIHIPLTDQQPIITAGRTLVPLRAVMEHLGFTVDWIEQDSRAVLTLDNQTVQVQIDNDQMQVGENIVILDVPAQLINGRTMVPVRAIAEATDFTVDWLAHERIVDITF